jgi:hypothetical protein
MSRSPYPKADNWEHLSLSECDAEIDRILVRREHEAKTHRKASFARLLSLEAFREQKFGVPAPVRHQRARQN